MNLLSIHLGIARSQRADGGIASGQEQAYRRACLVSFVVPLASGRLHGIAIFGLLVAIVEPLELRIALHLVYTTTSLVAANVHFVERDPMLASGIDTRTAIAASGIDARGGLATGPYDEDVSSGDSKRGFRYSSRRWAGNRGTELLP
ncbi:hypothetical protein DL89DRAFT_264900 [Linderina pennispora]|uniref:Uncharacterized protein n=1 Tax=Linderina pennispora TaxID=61395 RepID=A0A1Y1WHI6_9FUNG|nr:uncharacterized protein DL89DRAFT_264900 [Linderina pennispora]ORX72696.1 hypothetical protein DL89DRAFT_264900 [Linderina pennispora]